MFKVQNDSYSLSSSTQLMETIYPGAPVMYTNKMFTTQDTEKNVLVFTIDNFGHLVLLQKSKNNTGYMETFLDEGLPGGTKVIKMAAAKGKYEGSSIVAVVVEKEGVPSIWYTILYSDQVRSAREEQIKSLNTHKWISKGEYKEKRIDQIAIGYGRNETVQVAFSTIPESGSACGDVYMFIGSKKGKLDELSKIDLPEKAVSITGIGIGHDDDYESQYPNDVHGILYVLYKIGDGDDQNRMFSATYPKMLFKKKVSVNNDTTTFSLVDRKGYSLIFGASGNTAYLYDENALGIEEADFQGVNEKAVEIGKFDKPIKEFFPAYYESNDALHSFVLLKEEGKKGSDFYRLEESPSEGESIPSKKHLQKLWKLPIFHRSNVVLASANFHVDNYEVYMLQHAGTPCDNIASYKLVVQKQGYTDTDSIWHEQNFSIDKLDRKDSYYYKTYMMSIKLHDLPNPEKPLDYSKEEIEIKCSQNLMLKINNESVHTNNNVVIGKFNSQGICNIEVPAASIDSPLINIKSRLVPNIHQIDPALHVKEKLDELTKTEDSLKNARMKNRDGSYGNKLVPESSHKRITEVNKAITQMKKVIKNREQVTVNSIDEFNNDIGTEKFNNFKLTFQQDGTLAYQALSAEDLTDLYTEYNNGSYNWSFFDIGSIINFFKNAIEKISEIIVEKVNQTLKVLVRIGEYIWEGILSKLEQAWHLIGALLQDVLAIAADIIMDFFSFLFPWEEIKRTKRALNGLMTITCKRIKNELDSIESEKKIKQAFKKLSDELFGVGNQAEDEVIKKLKDKMGSAANKTLGQVSKENEGTYNKYLETPQVQWSNNLLSFQLSTEAGRYYDIEEPQYQSVGDELLDKIEKALKEFGEDTRKDIQDKYINIIKEIKNNPDITLISIIEKILKGIGKTILELTGDAFQAAFNIGKAVIDKVWSLITQKWDLGLLSRIYKKITGGDLTILDLICLLIAVPSTIIAKVIKPDNYDVAPENEVKLIEDYAQKESWSMEEFKEFILKMFVKDSAPNAEGSVWPKAFSLISIIGSIASYLLTPTLWVLKGISETIVSFINMGIVFANACINIVLSVLTNIATGWTNAGDIAELVYIGLCSIASVLINGMSLLVSIFLKDPVKKVCLIIANGALVISGLLSLLGSIPVAILKGVSIPVSDPKFADNILAWVQNVAGSLADASSGVAGGLLLVKNPAPNETSSAPDPILITIGIAIATYAVASVGFTGVFVVRLIVSCFTGLEQPEQEKPQFYAVMYR